MEKLAAAFKGKDIKALLFDLDDTLYDSKPIYARGLENAWNAFQKRAMDIQCSKKEFYDRYAKARLRTKVELSASPSKNSRLIYFHHLVTELLGQPRASLIFELDDAYSSAYAMIDFAPARQVLLALSKNYKIAVVTNQTQEAQLAKLQVLDPDGSLIHSFITSESIGCEKPDPAIFGAALREVNCTAAQAVMIGDDFEKDIVGAKQAGIHGLHLASHTEPSKYSTESSPILGCIQSLAQLNKIF